MRIQFLLAAVVTCAGTAGAQPPAPTFAPDGINIVKFSSRPVPPKGGWDEPNDSASATSQTMEDMRTVPSKDPTVSPGPVPTAGPTTLRGRDRVIESKKPRTVEAPIYVPPTSAPLPGATQNKNVYDYEVRIKNVGGATIMAVAWEYWFIEPASGVQMDRRAFRSFRKLEPGRSITLSSKSYGPRVVSAASQDKKGKQFEERVVIKCIAYSDGSWRSLDLFAESDCNDIKTHEPVQRR